ncbi:MAG: molybdopterin cofactor-binding domain-containing protein, partial [bacterium]
RWGGDIKDQSWFARDGFVRFVGDPVAAVAAETLEAAQAAIEAIRVRYEVLSPVTDLLAARAGEGPLVHEDWAGIGLGPGGGRNVIARFERSLGDVDAGFAQSDRVFEHTFTAPFMHPCYIELHACTAEAAADGKVTVWATTQSLYDLRDDLCDALGLPQSKVRVVPTEIGGGFGGKIHTTVEHIAALLAIRSGRVVRLEMTREEDHNSVNPRHPHHFRIRTGVNLDGTLVAREVDVTMDHGAYGRGAPFQCSSKMLMASSSYAIPNVRVIAASVYTNAPVCGPVRAPSGPQYHFATEVHLDIIARELGIDPFEIRRRNALTEGDVSLAGVEPGEALGSVLARAAEEGEWGTPIRANGRLDGEGWRLGRGMACGYWHGPGGAASCSIRLDTDGTFQIMSGSVNLTGATTSMCQLAAEELGVDLDRMRFTSGDTDSTPMSIRAAGSMMTRSLGSAVLNAAKDAREKIFRIAAEKLEASPEDLELEGGRVRVRSAPDRSMTMAQVAAAAPDVTGFFLASGDSPKPPPCPIHTAQVAEVAVNPELGEVRVLRLTCVQDVGFAINPLSVEGQIEGAMVQGMGIALMEEQARTAGGQIHGASLHEYLIPTSLDMPELKAVLLDNPAEGTPYGARGVGEPPIVATAAAIVNAMQDAVGQPFFSLPVGPHHVREALAGAGNGG